MWAKGISYRLGAKVVHMKKYGADNYDRQYFNRALVEILRDRKEVDDPWRLGSKKEIRLEKIMREMKSLEKENPSVGQRKKKIQNGKGLS